MHGLTSLRLLGGVTLLALVTLFAGDPPAALAQKKKAPTFPIKDPTKKPAPVVASTIPAGQKLTADQLARHIDKMVLAHLKTDKVDPSPVCSDEEFVRRVYLDVTGKIPTAEKVVAFLDSKESNKRARLIDELLAGNEFGKHMADVWQALLLPRNSDNARLRQWYPNLVKWLEEKFNAGTGWDVMVKDMLTATGAVDKNGPVVYWLANNTADKVTDNVSRMFLGVQLQCAQCHNHPFTDWKQDEYWGMAAFFLKVRPDGNPRGAAKKGGTVSISEAPRVAGKMRGLPESAKILPPKYLQGEKPAVKGTEPVRPLLASWMTSSTNPFFSRSMVNRTWGQFFGRGFVNPVDDMHEGNAPSHPELLADLAGQYAANGFDTKYLIRAICNSETYQRSSKPSGNNGDAGPESFARMAVKPLSPEQLYDSLTMLVGTERRAAQKNKAVGRGAGNVREQFVAFFSAEDGADPTEYQTGIPQVLRLMNAPQLNSANVLAPILRTAKSKEEGLEKMYLTVLARRPRVDETERMTNFLRKAGSEREGMASVLWVLMNSSEFAMNR